eukprot:Phypoly_transcript_03177.p1 GENE.Phypoly_transcript_03177~~Phypoly_transcript_03177.p1  ORF type:complete len:811 (+),score=167.67 Phypoly_transcript_03177:73-2505(+)
MAGLMGNDLPLNLSVAEKKTIDSYITRPEFYLSFVGRFMAPPKKPMKPNQEIIFVLGKLRALFVYAGGKVANECALFDLVEIDTPTPRDITLKFRNFSQTLLSTSKIPEIIAHIQKYYAVNFPGMPVPFLGDNVITAEVGPCGGFSTTFRCLSDYLNTPIREDIAYDVEVFYSPSNIHELNLNEWPEPPNLAQSRALIVALKYNEWFTSLVAKGPAVKVGNEGIVAVTDVLQTNKKIEKLELVSVGSHEAWITNEIWMTFALNNYLTNVSLSSNPIEDKGCAALCTHWLSTVSHPIFSLNLDKCDIGFKGMHLLFRTLRENKWVAKHLKTLCISYNKIEDSAGELVLFLRDASSLTKLEISYTNPTWSALKTAATQPEFSRHSTKQLTRLGLAGNKIPRPEIFSDIAAFLHNAAPALTDLDLSATSLPLSPFPTRALFAAIPNLVRLELADNEFGEDGIHTLVDILTGSDPQPLLKLKTLTLDRNIALLDRGPANKRHLKGHGIKALTKLISQKSNLLCPIETLKFSATTNTRLRYEILPIITALATNETITDLDITGHYAGDDLAVALGRALQVNHTLRTLYIDENQVSVVGLEFKKKKKKKNFTLTRMPIPVIDISDQLKMAENTAGLQQLRERLRLPTDTTQANLQARSQQLVGEIQSYVAANNVRTFHESLKSKAAARKTIRLQEQPQQSQQSQSQLLSQQSQSQLQESHPQIQQSQQAQPQLQQPEQPEQQAQQLQQSQQQFQQPAQQFQQPAQQFQQPAQQSQQPAQQLQQSYQPEQLQQQIHQIQQLQLHSQEQPADLQEPIM